MVPAHRLKELAAIRDAQPAGSVRASITEADRVNETVTLFGTTYAASDEADDKVTFRFLVNEQDRQEFLGAVRQAKQTSDFSIATMHTHEPGNYSEEPPDFLVTTARECIDAGADAFIGHGPHQLRGIELYQGRPIFYSLGNFFYTKNTMHPLTPDEGLRDAKADRTTLTPAEYQEHVRVHGVFRERVWFESVITVSRFNRHGHLRSIELHPVELHWDGPRDADRGIPRLAAADVAENILSRLQRLSKPFNTEITVKDGVGYVDCDG
jgi:poly-gamma-glutamate synthesis protein (capsule biosynthesis protein)